MGYFTQTDLENALGKATVKGAYSDSHGAAFSTDELAAIAACIAYGSAQCDSFLRNLLMTSSGTPVTLPLTTVPDEVKFAALDFGIAYTIRRRPDVVKAMNEQPWTVFHDAAIEQMKRYCSSMQRISPTGVGIAATAGGEVFGPDPDDDDLPVSRWGDLGDFS